LTDQKNVTASRRFVIGEEQFHLDGEPFQILCGEVHFTRIPREYWRHRLKLCRAMGLNTVCAYLFWNFHEFERGRFVWEGQADAAAFCRIAQEEGLWALLRPGPYACAEWDGGGLPWWLLKEPDMRLRSSDERFMAAAEAWLSEVGRELAPLQITHGGPILMAQVENEYGSYGTDAAYMGRLRQIMVESGFEVPLFACNPVADLARGFREDLFQTVNFSSDPRGAFEALRRVQRKGPLMSGEFYPGWFDVWGARHSRGDIEPYLADLGAMVASGASFSIYMAHGGTTFGLWAGADRPFRPDTSSYDYDAPIGEAGGIGEKFWRTRETLAQAAGVPPPPDPPPRNPVISIEPFALTLCAPVFENLPPAVADDEPRNFETYGIGQGCCLYRRELAAGAAATLRVEAVRDFAWVFLDGALAGVLDRRSRRFGLQLPARTAPARLDILVEAMGHVNFGVEIHDRKGLIAPVRLVRAGAREERLVAGWSVFPLPLDASTPHRLAFTAEPGRGPAFWRGAFAIEETGDTFLDLRSWSKGVVWINGRCLARFWNIGPTQTAYLPGPWLKRGVNEVVILDLVGPQRAVVAGLTAPILDELRPRLEFAASSPPEYELTLDGIAPARRGSFAPDAEAETIMFDTPLAGRQFCFEALNAHDGRRFAAVAELDLLDQDGRSLSHERWSIAYVDSEETAGGNCAALNAINGQTASFWHTGWTGEKPDFPHELVIDLGERTVIGGFRYVPRRGNPSGRVKDYRVYVGDKLAG
jgi:beta-galactosidase